MREALTVAPAAQAQPLAQPLLEAASVNFAKAFNLSSETAVAHLKHLLIWLHDARRLACAVVERVKNNAARETAVELGKLDQLKAEAEQQGGVEGCEGVGGLSKERIRGLEMDFLVDADKRRQNLWPQEAIV